MWIVLFHDTPHFWLVGGESYRVGKANCHVVIQDDRSISRTHLTITVGLQSSTGARDAGEWAPQPISLLDSSTYGTAIVACGEDADDAETLDDTPHNGGDSHAGGAGGAASPAPEMGVLGLCYAPAAAAAAAAPRKRQRSGSTSGRGAPQPALQLTKEVPFHVPVYRSSWHQFTIHLGHHGAALKLVWLDVSALCEDVDVEVQPNLLHALHCCGVRQETVSGSTQALSATETQGSAVGRSRTDGSGLSLSQRSAVAGTPSATPSPTAVTAAAAAVGEAALSSRVLRCYNTVNFLVTSTVQPSTAVVAMLCRAVPIVTPAFFMAVCDRASPQIPLPDPSRYLPPLSSWWRDFLTHVRPSADEPRHCGGDASVTAFTLTPPATTVTSVAGESAAAAAAASHLRYFAPHPRRRELFSGITFLLLQWPLYEEVLSYLDGTGARVVWEDSGVGGLSGPLCASTSSSRAALEALQSFFVRHQRHVLLFNETEPLLPWPGCMDVVRHGLSLCSVEYGTLIEAIVTMRPLPLPPYPADAQMPRTFEEVEARVSAATALVSTLPAATAQEAAEEHTQDSDEGRRTDAQPLFPELVGGSDAGVGHSHMRDTGVHRRPRKEDVDGWVSFERPATVAPLATGLSTDKKPNGSATVRTVELLVGPYSLPPYPCFEDANAASADASATAAAAVGSARGAKLFVKQALPPPEPLVELEEHRARRQLAASMLTARVPTVDAENVVPEQVVMGNGGLASRVAEATSAAFNAFDTVAHHASSRRRGTAARRGGRRGGASAAAARTPANRLPRGGMARVASRCPADNIVSVEDEEDMTAGSFEATATRSGRGGDVPASAEDSAVFHIFDIDGIF
ncbi:conserved hypothetical protein [Leishmania major strain Friedlin]|uniref:FHA domain-containing protein n=1 Tax=Leishmania major TaxID=5664 RepID=Q4QJ51_LEIMA|nr:conserved hypothetical protein [Leishmania major strain Friedlin]CAG9568821.1 hypothetical_protein_-_conserved [Leishmania major strain Friedlin]CAJ02071.1 conserved hypothetical protein [Leishmania major strain Friedlin]|eukprot:XP_001680797.1 conserved hypothetical protein [Leishmania major strain Friedlin]